MALPAQALADVEPVPTGFVSFRNTTEYKAVPLVMIDGIPSRDLPQRPALALGETGTYGPGKVFTEACFVLVAHPRNPMPGQCGKRLIVGETYDILLVDERPFLRAPNGKLIDLESPHQ
ncbi:MAG: hypothetical protein U0166_02190 [Acidobacteriota bacterium]